MMRRSGRAVFPAVILSLATLGLSLDQFEVNIDSMAGVVTISPK
jgi:hypothetical protein